MRSDQAKFQWAVHEALHHAERAFDHIGAMSMQEFSRHPMAIDAVTRCIGVIGEAAVRAKKASAQIYAEHPQLEQLFDDLREARNAAIHEYEHVDPESVYLTMQETVRPLADACRAFLGDSKEVRVARLVLRIHDRYFPVPVGFATTLGQYADEEQIEAMHRQVGDIGSLKELLEAQGIVIPTLNLD